MKSKATYKSTLGLLQEEMAMLLQISTGQWAMFTSQKRDIPTAAMLQLAEIVSATHKIQSPAAEALKIKEIELQKNQDWLKRESKSVTHKIMILDRKIQSMENIRSKCYAALEVVNYLENQLEEKQDAVLIKIIKSRVTSTLNKNAFQKLREMQLKRDSLITLRNSLEKELKE